MQPQRICRVSFFSLLCFCALTLAPASAQWDQWRGPQRDGVVRGIEAPAVWPDSLRLQWGVNVGEGQATPLVQGDRVYVFSRIDSNQGVTCLDRASGAMIWRSEEPVDFNIVHRDAYKVGKGPKSTPLLHEGRLYALDIDGRLSAYDANDGSVVWRHDFAGEFKQNSPYFGASMSPLVAGGNVVVHVGGNDSGALRAFDPQSGDTVWSWDEPPSHASPIVVMHNGMEQIVTQSQNFRAGLDAASGEVLWQEPFTTPWDETTPTPVLYGGDRVVFAGLRRGMTALRLPAAGAEAELVWFNQDGSSYLNSAVLSGERLLSFSHYNKGQFLCLEAATGEPLWMSKGRQGDNAALLAWEGKWLALKTDGELLVLEQGASAFAPLRRYRVAASETWAHPVVLPEGVLIKDFDGLGLWTWGGVSAGE